MTDNERIQRLERLLEVSRNLSASLDLDPFLQSVISVATELTGSEVASVLEPEDGGTHLGFLAVPWFHRDALKMVKVPINASVAGWVFENVKPAVVVDVSAEPRHFKAADQATDFQTRSILAVPIVYKGEALGVLEAVNKANHAHYTEDDLTILETLASQTAIALENTRLVDKVRQSLDEMSQLDRMKSDFIAIASHELRTPLGLILGHSTFLCEVVGDEHRNQMEVIARNAMRLKEIIDSFGTMDNVQFGVATVRRRSISIRRIVEEVTEAFAEEVMQKNLSLRMDMGEDDLMVDGDATKISLALSNLVKNAITFTNPEGHIFIIAERIPGYVKVAVIDDGVGIPAADLPRIFERFFQVESHLTRRHGGMGLGLSVAKVMIELHSGRIWAESMENKGSNFTFILPLDSGQADAADDVFRY